MSSKKITIFFYNDVFVRFVVANYRITYETHTTDYTTLDSLL